MDARFVAFVSVTGLLIITPGPDMALVARSALRSGSSAAAATALGIGAGSVVWGVAAAFGIAALLAQSAAAFTILKLAGAAYLLYLGWKALRSGLSDRPGREAASSSSETSRAAALHQGFIGNLLNPKAAAIFVTVIPQFIRPGDSPTRIALMLIAFELMLVSWLLFYGSILSRAGRSRTGVRVRRVLQMASGVVLMAFAVRLATERR